MSVQPTSVLSSIRGPADLKRLGPDALAGLASEIRDFLASDSFDIFADFGDACRAELAGLQMRGVAYGPSMFRLMPTAEVPRQ